MIRAPDERCGLKSAFRLTWDAETIALKNGSANMVVVRENMMDITGIQLQQCCYLGVKDESIHYINIFTL